MSAPLSARSSGLLLAIVILSAIAASGCSASDGETVAGATTDTAQETTLTVDEGADDSELDDSELDDTGTTSDSETTSDTEPPSSTVDEPTAFPPLGEQTAPIEVRGEALEQMPAQIPVTEPDNDPAIGRTAPEIFGTDFAGAPVEIVADGTPRVIMFVAHWCPHCQREVPAVLELIASGALPDGLELVIVSTAAREGEELYPPQTWLQNEGWRGPIIRDSEDFDALLAFGAGGFPFSVYLNADHQVVTRSAGEIPTDIIEQLWLATAAG